MLIRLVASCKKYGGLYLLVVIFTYTLMALFDDLQYEFNLMVVLKIILLIVALSPIMKIYSNKKE